MLKKTFQALLVLIAVVSAVYVLQNNSVFDPVQDFLASSFGERSFDEEVFRATYEKEAIKQHKDLPGFYFSLVPPYFPDDLNKIVFLEERKFKKSLLRYSKCLECVEDFLNAQKALANKEKLIQQNHELSSLMSKIRREKDLSKLSVYISKFSQQAQSDSIVGAVAEQLATSWKGLEKQEFVGIFPKFSWNGTQNQYLCNTIS